MAAALFILGAALVITGVARLTISGAFIAAGAFALAAAFDLTKRP